MRAITTEPDETERVHGFLIVGPVAPAMHYEVRQRGEGESRTVATGFPDRPAAERERDRLVAIRRAIMSATDGE
jgi:hypothetical protein